MKVLIVGGVAGGAGTAARLRRNCEDAEIILFERGSYISFANCGLPYFIGGVITEKAALQLQTPQSFRARFNIDVRVEHEVCAVSTEAKTVRVKNLSAGAEYDESYDILVLSPGAKPVRPPIPGIETAKVFTLRNIPDTYSIDEFVAQTKPVSCAIVGAGFIGLEMAENLASRGMRVSVIEAANQALPPLDEDMAHEVHNYLRAKGIRLYLGKKCVEFRPGQAVLDDGSSVEAGMVVLSIGVAPDTSFLKESGIPLGARGEILTDEYLETGVPGVYALGDAVAVRQLVSGAQALIPLAGPANKQGRIVADNICGKRTAYKGSQGTAIIKLFDMTVAVTGEKEAALKRAGIEYLKTFTYSASHAGYYPGARMMSVKLLYAPDGRVLGAQITGGEGVDKRIDTLAAAVRFGLTVYDLQEMELAYAPPFSSAKDPVNMAGYVAANRLEGKMIPFFMEDLPLIPKDAVRLDVRTAAEYERGHIDGFVNIPLDSLRERLGELDLSREIWITCQIGLRGYLAQRILEQRGAHTRNLSGGYRLYEAARNDEQVRAASPEPCTSCGKPV